MADNRNDMSCARVKTYTASRIGAAERHNERKNSDYGNVNVDAERIPYNIHFKDPGEKTYLEILREKEAAGEISERGLRADAVLFDEIVFDVNTMYFVEHGGYEYAKKFYEEAYRYACRKYGEENIISAVMHADEINKAASDDLGRPVYHYHMHLVALPVVEKEIRWSKRCKDPALVGTVKEVIRQISHSKKWASVEPIPDSEGNPVLRRNGKIKYRASYSVLQDEFYGHMTGHGFDGFQSGKEGSTAEHLTSLQYQIEKDTERLKEIDQKIRAAELKYEPAEAVSKTYREIENSGKKTITGKYTVSKEDYDQLTALAKEGITSRREIGRPKDSVRFYQDRSFRDRNAFDQLQERYDNLVERCRPFLEATRHFPDLARSFLERIRRMIAEKEAAGKTAREKRYSTRIQKENRSRDEER